ncbi:pilus assembly protein PilP [Desulfobacter vibrioformis]|uniref:pilus assembly protein PilP n=1 Tax=Desulfobacter vibrioformis TaxID=34031 RepID=UPI000554D08D|nr:pilus assembly protein PilP [Desulfobacter vibrioformis]
MEKLIKICCLAGLVVSLLFVCACNEDQAPGPELAKQTLVVSKSISKPNPPASQTPDPGDAGKKQALVPDLKPARDSVNADGEDKDKADALQKAGISMPMEQYDSKGRVDPFIPLIAEKNIPAGSGASVDTKPKRPLTPLEKLELSQIKLVAIVEMSDRTIAMVEDATGKGYEVAIGTYIGSQGGRVTSVTMKGITIEENMDAYNGKSRKRYEEIKFHKSEDGE